MRVLAKLKMQGDYYNYNQPTVVDFFQDASRDGLKAAIDKRKMWNEMRMSPTDLADLSANVLTYLMNGTTPAGNWTGLFRPGERVRLRFINRPEERRVGKEWASQCSSRVSPYQ